MDTPDELAHSDTAQTDESTETGRSKGKNRNSQKGRQRDRLILALLQQPTLEKAAASIGISTSTAHRIRRTEEFQREYLQARREAMTHARARLQQGAAAAASTFLRIMVDPKERAATRLRAAAFVWESANQGLDAEIREHQSDERSRKSSDLDAALEKLRNSTEALAKSQPIKFSAALPKVVLEAVAQGLSDERLKMLISASRANEQGRDMTPEEAITVLNYAQLIEAECQRLGFSSAAECQRLYYTRQVRDQQRKLLSHLSDEKP